MPHDRFARIRFQFPIILILTAIIFSIGGCDSEEKLVAESKYHPPGWTSFPAEESHGAQALKNGISNCYDCHGAELAGGISKVACADCHGNGQDNCAACHGGLLDTTGAPPYALDGSIDDTALAVGAHFIHLNGSEISNGVACVSCHIIPDHPWDTAHFDYSIYDGPGISDSVAEVIWGGIAGEAGTWDRTARTCSDTYCHGNFRNGYPDNTPIWTNTEQAECATCHDDGSDIFHMNRDHIFHTLIDVGCESCHASTIDKDKNIIGPEFHIDGVSTVKFYPDSGSFSNGACSNPGGCHGDQIWH